jgi:hypothetical protein
VIDDYFQYIEALISSTGIVHSTSITYDKRSVSIGFIRGNIYFLDGSLLHVREFVNQQPDIERYMYVYQYQSATGDFVFRYDNTPHFPHVSSFPHHKHEGNEAHVVATPPPNLETVLEEVRRHLSNTER